MSLYDLFKDRAVHDVHTVEEFLTRYYRADRYTAQGAEYAAYVLAYHRDLVEHDGFTFISHHESTTGQVVAFYASERQKRGSAQPSLWDLLPAESGD